MDSERNIPNINARDYATYVSTPEGTSIPVTRFTFELSDSEIRSINAQMDASYPVAVRIEPASRMYNCHSYTWYNKSASNKYWMPYPWNAQKIGYMNDGS